MIPDKRLSEWADTPERYRRSEAGINRFAGEWNQGPHNRRIAAAMSAVSAPKADLVADAVCRLFQDEKWAGALINALTEEMRSDPFFVPPFRHINSDVHQGLILYEDELVSIALGISNAIQLAAKKDMKRGATSIGFTGQVSVLKFVKSGAARLSLWEAPFIGPDFSRANAGTCRKTGEHHPADGEIMIVDGRFQSFVIEHAQSNVVLLQAVMKPDQAPLSVEYDSACHEYIGCSAADDSASRIQMIVTLLRKLDRADAFPVIAAFLDNPNFYVRWHVMRELLGLDAMAALPFLERMAAEDSHEENKNAAGQVLDSLRLSKAA